MLPLFTCVLGQFVVFICQLTAAGVNHNWPRLDTKISGQQSLVGVILLLLKWDLVNCCFKSHLPHLDILQLFDKTLFNNVNDLVFTNSILSQPQAFVYMQIEYLLNYQNMHTCNFGWFASFTECLFKFSLDLCKLLLFICPSYNFIFNLFCPKYCVL